MNIPTIQELQQALINAFEQRFGTINRGMKAVFRVIAVVLASQLKLYYLFAARIQKNTFPDLADRERDGGNLERFGRARLGRNPFPATAGQYLVNVTGSAGAVIRSGVTFRSRSGFLFVNDNAFTLTGTNDQITLRALTPGLDARLAVNDELTSTEPILSVQSNVTVASESVAPLNAETTEAYRELILQTYRIEAQGGASGDYRLWSADAQGVRRVYPYVGDPNEVNIFVEANIADSTDQHGTPSQTIIANVVSVVNQDPDTTKNLEERGRKPLGVIIDAQAVTPIPVNVTVAGYTGDTTAAVTLIDSAIETYLMDIRPYIPGVDAFDNGVLYSNRLIGVITDAVGRENNFDSITITVGGSEVNLRRFENGDIPFINTVTVNA